MTKGRTRGRQSGEFASGARNRSDAAEGAAPEPHASVSPGDAATELLLDTPIGTPRTPKDFEPLVTTQGSGRLDFSAMLAIADVLPVMIGYVAYADGDFVLQFVNKPFAEWLERPRAELIGRRVVDIVGAERLKDREPLYRRALAGERIFYVSEYDHPSSGRSALQSNYVPWAGADGAVHGFIVIHQDVTEQRTAERALKESEARFRRIANQAPVLMWVTRLDRIRDFVNDAYMEFLGTEDREFARTYDWRSGIHPDDVERIIQELIAGEASMQAFTLEGRFRARRRRVSLAEKHQQPALRAGRGAYRVYRGGDRYHAHQGGRARASAAGRGADRAADRIGGAVPRGV